MLVILQIWVKVNKALEAVSTSTATYNDFKRRFRPFQKSNNPLRVLYAEVHFLPTIFDRALKEGEQYQVASPLD